MHYLFSHVKACLKKYGTVGLFAEDYFEVIHALMNRIVAAFIFWIAIARQNRYFVYCQQRVLAP
jgi:hypothetical protein